MDEKKKYINIKSLKIYEPKGKEEKLNKQTNLTNIISEGDNHTTNIAMGSNDIIDINNPKDKKNDNQSDKNKCKLALKILITISIISLTLNVLFLIILLKNNSKPKCKDGYFLPTNDKKICYKCEIPNCSKCIGSTDNQICNYCMENFEPKYGKDGTKYK